MTSATEEKTPSQPGRSHERPARHAGAWVESLRRSDVSRLWTELQRLVINHPLVRASHSAGLLVEEGDRGSAYLDMTQELFVTLLASLTASPAASRPSSSRAPTSGVWTTRAPRAARTSRTGVW
ncbi:MAG: hypothetical protein LC802_06095 [Acidobacteria bacterium]|nr:hypothetical protein [Acidobacteriota bacterium]